jgi:hypothetical protein
MLAEANNAAILIDGSKVSSADGEFILIQDRSSERSGSETSCDNSD